MPSINIEGVGRVNVGEEFFSLPPEKQDATVDEISKTLRGEQPGVAEDVAKSFGVGVGKGALAIPGSGGDVRSLAEAGARKLGLSEDKMPLVGRTLGALPVIGPLLQHGPTTEQLQKGGGVVPGRGVEGITGEFRKPQTPYGRAAETVGEFVPGALIPGGAASSFVRGIPGNLARYAVAPGLASEAAGNIPGVQGTALEPWVRGAAAVATGGGASFVGRPSVAKTMTRGAIPEGVTAAQLDAAEQLFAQAQHAGQPITRAEALQYVTGNATRLGDLQRLAEGQGEMREFFAPRAEQNQVAMRDTAATFGPRSGTPSQVGPAVGEAAEGALQDTRNFITNATSGAYNAADRVPLGPQEMARMRALPGYAEARNAVLNDPQLLRYTNGLPEDTVGFQHEIKKWLGTASENATAPLNQQANRQIGAGYGRDTAAADETLRNASFAYRAAQDAQTRLRAQYLDPLIQGDAPLGRLAQKDITTQRAIDTLFPRDPNIGSAAEMGDAVRALAHRNPEAAQQLVRAHVESVFDQTARNLVGGPNQYGGAKFAVAVRGTPQQAENLQAIVRALPNGDQLWHGLDQFLQIVEAQGTRQRPGSLTAFNQEALADFKRGTPLQELGSAAATGGIKLPQRILEAYQRIRLGRGVTEVGRLLTDPEGAMRFRQLATMPRGGEQAARVAARLVLLADASAHRDDPRGPKGPGGNVGNNGPLRVRVSPADATR